MYRSLSHAAVLVNGRRSGFRDYGGQSCKYKQTRPYQLTSLEEWMDEILSSSSSSPYLHCESDVMRAWVAFVMLHAQHVKRTAQLCCVWLFFEYRKLFNLESFEETRRRRPPSRFSWSWTHHRADVAFPPTKRERQHGELTMLVISLGWLHLPSRGVLEHIESS